MHQAQSDSTIRLPSQKVLILLSSLLVNQLLKDALAFHYRLVCSKPEDLHQVATFEPNTKQIELWYQFGCPLHPAVPRNRPHKLATQRQIIAAVNLHSLHWLDVIVKMPPRNDLCGVEDYRDASVGMNRPAPVLHLPVELFPLFHTPQPAPAPVPKRSNTGNRVVTS